MENFIKGHMNDFIVYCYAKSLNPDNLTDEQKKSVVEELKKGLEIMD